MKRDPDTPESIPTLGNLWCILCLDLVGKILEETKPKSFICQGCDISLPRFARDDLHIHRLRPLKHMRRLRPLAKISGHSLNLAHTWGKSVCIAMVLEKVSLNGAFVPSCVLATGNKFLCIVSRNATKADALLYGFQEGVNCLVHVLKQNTGIKFNLGWISIKAEVSCIIITVGWEGVLASGPFPTKRLFGDVKEVSPALLVGGMLETNPGSDQGLSLARNSAEKLIWTNAVSQKHCK